VNWDFETSRFISGLLVIMLIVGLRHVDSNFQGPASGSWDYGVPSIFKVIRKDEALVRVLSTFDFRFVENVTRQKWNSPLLHCGN
jgi:hypothetical protein